MSSISLKNLTLSVYGESHGPCIGAVLTGFPAGHKIDFDSIKKDMDKRKPGGKLATKRKEDDCFEFSSGVLNGYTTGAPICVRIPNTSQHSSDYENLRFVPRPSHADYPAFLKYKGFSDIRGGGHFSGRLTAPLVCVGSLCGQYLSGLGITVKASVAEIGGIKNDDSNGVCERILQLVSEKAKEGDSVGGKVRCVAVGVPAGIGGPLFDGFEGVISRLVFGIPAVKALEFGIGTEFADSVGSRVNDEYVMSNGKPTMLSNNNGGVLGGITTGSDLDFTVTFKPTPSIYKTQRSVNLKTSENTELKIEGRHDPCIVLRAVPVVEAVAALGIMDMVMR